MADQSTLAFEALVELLEVCGAEDKSAPALLIESFDWSPYENFGWPAMLEFAEAGSLPTHIPRAITKPDELRMMRILLHNAARGRHTYWPRELQSLGIHWKRARYIVRDKWSWNWVEWGTTWRGAWLTEAGANQMHGILHQILEAAYRKEERELDRLEHIKAINPSACSLDIALNRYCP